jgi:pimeloyl-ACP methyl ester carboxylesterase
MIDPQAYRARSPSRISTIPIRDAVYRLRSWGAADAPPLVLLHGTRDTSITFQFVVDALQRDWHVVAPDWRGHGGTESVNRSGWFHDYLGDLDEILGTMFPDQAIDLVGHSLGGNIASTYAGLCPTRVRHMVALDAFGIMGPSADDFAETLALWLNGGAENLKRYDSTSAMARALCRVNPRLPAEKAAFLAEHSSRSTDGGYAWAFDQRTRRSIPVFHSLDEWAACWRRIQATSLWVAAGDPLPGTVRAHAKSFNSALDAIGRERVVRVADSGHNVQHDQPEAVAALIENFLTCAPAEKRRAVLAVPGVDDSF